MAANTEGPAGEFKRVLTLAMKTIAEEPELTVTFGSEHAGLSGNQGEAAAGHQ